MVADDPFDPLVRHPEERVRKIEHDIFADESFLCLVPHSESAKMDGDDVIGRLISVCRRDISKKNLKGFMMAPWASCDTKEHMEFNLKGVDLFVEALKEFRG